MKIFGFTFTAEKNKKAPVGLPSSEIRDLQERMHSLEQRFGQKNKRAELVAADEAVEQTEIERILSTPGNTSKPADLWGTLSEV